MLDFPEGRAVTCSKTTCLRWVIICLELEACWIGPDWQTAPWLSVRRRSRRRWMSKRDGLAAGLWTKLDRSPSPRLLKVPPPWPKCRIASPNTHRPTAAPPNHKSLARGAASSSYSGPLFLNSMNSEGLAKTRLPAPPSTTPSTPHTPPLHVWIMCLFRTVVECFGWTVRCGGGHWLLLA